jgi:hypothetical protein
VVFFLLPVNRRSKLSGKGLQHPDMTYDDYERYYSAKDRSKMPDSDFAGPHSSFPVRTQQDVYNAARLVGHAADPAAVKAAIIRIAKRKGFALPDAWKEDEKPKEAAAVQAWKPKPRIARIKSYFLEDDAISLNGRKYPTSAVDKLIQSAQVQLSDPNALPLTCYLSHDKADQDSTLDIAGKITSVGREGHKAYAMIDIPDTQTGREVATLVSGGYIRSQSLRASGAEMRADNESAFPLVGGASLKLEGIDFTSSPGLPQVARIAELVTESHEPQTLQEIFNTHPTSMILEEEKSMETIKEEGIDPITSGVTQGMTADNPKDEYAQRQYPTPQIMQDDDASIDQSIHDHIAHAMSLECSTMISGENSVLRKQLQEAGAKFNKNVRTRLLAAHDAISKKTGVQCSTNGNGKMASDGMQDGDNDDGPDTPNEAMHTLLDALREAATPASQPAKITQPVKAKETHMTKEEALKLLAESGYSVQAPPTEEEKLQEKLAAMQAEFDKKLTEAQSAQIAAFKQALAESKAPQVPPQRKTLVEGAAEQVSRHYYRNGDYLREKIQSLDFERMLDRSAPIPEGIDPERLLRELYTATVSLTPDEWNRGKMFQG